MFIFKFIRRIISFILLLIIVIPLYVAGSIWYTARNSSPVKSDVILVMGAAQFDGRPSEILQSRLDESLKIYKSGLAPRIYTVGSGAPGDRTTEAAASRAWLIDNGVKKSAISSIAKGRDTLGSTQAYAEVMKKANLNSVVIVTDPYHCLRSTKMAKDLGLSASCAPVETGPAAVANSGYKYLARETGAYLAYITVGRLGIKLSDRLISTDLYS
ncbi:MAG: YdcF family protein [Candidatus Nanopelagicus sp.]